MEIIQRKLKALQKDGYLEELQTQIKEKVRHRVRNPKPVSGITKTSDYKSWHYDPRITVSLDIKDHQGNIIAAKGTTFNPLSKLGFGSSLLFIDGTDQDQVTWSLSHHKRDSGIKIILVKGSPFELMEKHEEITFYFDQMGKITEKFNLTHVPAKVTQDELVLKVEEVVLEEDNA